VGVPGVGVLPAGESTNWTRPDCPADGGAVGDCPPLDKGTGNSPGIGGGSGANGDESADVGVTGEAAATLAEPLADADIEIGSPAWHIEGTVAPMSKPRSTVLAIVFIDLPDLATWRPCTGYAGGTSYSERFGKIGRAS